MSSELPAELTSFIGRTSELRAVAQLLDRCRMLTLTGPGGVGKTRIALHAAAELAAAYPDGVYLVQLSELQDGSLVAHTIGTVLGVPEPAGGEMEAITGYLAGKQALLILDTCEHLIDECAAIAGTLLRGAATLRVLATSRQPLDVPGEHVLPIAPLDVPDPDAPARRCDALDLFAERAAAAVNGFSIDDEAGRRLALEVCRRLDGLPLAIELAAVRLRAFSLEQLAARLDDRFQLLSAGNRTALPRHQTLRGMIGWSHELCSPAERLLWARLSVFAGGFDLAAVEAVCSGGGPGSSGPGSSGPGYGGPGYGGPGYGGPGYGGGLAAGEIMGLIAALVDKSIVLRAYDQDSTWFRMLDTVREYSREWLTSLGEDVLFRSRHRDYYLAQARLFDAGWQGPAQLDWFRRMRRDHANIRLALEYALDSDPALCLELAGSLANYWFGTSRFGEGRYWLDRALAAAGPSAPKRARALWATGHILLVTESSKGAADVLEQAREAAERAGVAGQLDLAESILCLGMAAMLAGDLDRAVAQIGDARALFTALGDTARLSATAHMLAFIALAHGDVTGALDVCAEALGMLDAAECIHRSWLHVVQSIAFWVRGQYAECAEMAGRAARLKLAFGDLAGIGWCLEFLGWVAAEQRQPYRAAWTLGAAEAVWRKQGVARMGYRLADKAHAAARGRAREQLGGQAFDEAFGVGMALPLDEAVTRATGDPDEPALSRSPLTRREQEIAGLVADGLSNREVASRLVISKRTVDTHVEHILTKLGYRNRTQIATWLSGGEDR
jgi:predicted ATPase/DNA-binding CsgD family transcriptional regulator